MSKLSLVLRFVQQGVHKDKILGVKQKLQNAIARFQVHSSYMIYKIPLIEKTRW